jgi:hypothetical protein
MSQSSESESFDPRRRRLCPDGSCVGVIGADGRCRVCGTVSPEGPPAAGLGPEAFAGGCAEGDEEEAEAMGGNGDAFADIEGEVGAVDPSRALCPDGDCLGVLGPDRRCNVCGRAAEG